MPRPKYAITAADVTHAHFYLDAKVRGFLIKFDKQVSHSQALRDLDKASLVSGKAKRAEALNSWCVKYLSTTEWNRLKPGIRKRRERMQRHNEQTSITISVKAHALLTQVAKRDDATFTEVLEYYLSKAANSARKMPGSAKNRTAT
jgi:macrodomain Ter protein organizer (MatP/YcbG family)